MRAGRAMRAAICTLEELSYGHSVSQTKKQYPGLEGRVRLALGWER